jgi:hypothetical protein
LEDNIHKFSIDFQKSTQQQTFSNFVGNFCRYVREICVTLLREETQLPFLHYMTLFLETCFSVEILKNCWKAAILFTNPSIVHTIAVPKESDLNFESVREELNERLNKLATQVDQYITRTELDPEEAHRAIQLDREPIYKALAEIKKEYNEIKLMKDEYRSLSDVLLYYQIEVPTQLENNKNNLIDTIRKIYNNLFYGVKDETIMTKFEMALKMRNAIKHFKNTGQVRVYEKTDENIPTAENLTDFQSENKNDTDLLEYLEGKEK